jgi:hypothetical protein
LRPRYAASIAFPEVRDPAEAATPGVGGRDYLNSRVVFRQMLASARFMQ